MSSARRTVDADIDDFDGVPTKSTPDSRNSCGWVGERRACSRLVTGGAPVPPYAVFLFAVLPPGVRYFALSNTRSVWPEALGAVKSLGVGRSAGPAGESQGSRFQQTIRRSPASLKMPG